MNSDLAKPFILYSRPGSSFIAGDKVMVSVYNPDAIELDMFVSHFDHAGKRTLIYKQPAGRNPISLNITDKPGRIQMFVRERAPNADKPIQSNAIWGDVFEEDEQSKIKVARLRESEHRVESAIQRSSAGALTLHNPWVLPGNAACLDEPLWFPVHVMEGSTSLYNMPRRYYADPLGYFIDSIKVLKDKGYHFVTWHDVIDDSVDMTEKTAILQFDIDAGPNSFTRVSEAICELGLTASAMIHRRARHWYHYDLEQQNIAHLHQLEKQGWCIGYHHNSLTNLVAFEPEKASEQETKAQAQMAMREDVIALREYFDIRTLTHHGGNLYNRDIAIPDDLDVLCVDRPFSPELWNGVKKSFSDGGFLARPMPLDDFVTMAGQESVFLRCHPLKYGNFPDGLDVKPITARSEGSESDNQTVSETPSEIEKQNRWIESRSKSRSGTLLGYASTNKPLSSKFKRTNAIESAITELRAKRRPDFLRQYPWADGDPRVIWCRLLSSFTSVGTFLNVGAMPPEQKGETWSFIPDESRLLELDIDPKREPDILADFCVADFKLEDRFDTILLNGLPYFSAPQVAVRNALKLLNPGGTLLIGAAAASHPERGGMFRPGDRPIWRQGKQDVEGQSLSLTTRLWSFSDKSIDDLALEWSGTWMAEFINNYWFVVAQKKANV